MADGTLMKVMTVWDFLPQQKLELDGGNYIWYDGANLYFAERSTGDVFLLQKGQQP